MASLAASSFVLPACSARSSLRSGFRSNAVLSHFRIGQPTSAARRIELSSQGTENVRVLSRAAASSDGEPKTASEKSVIESPVLDGYQAPVEPKSSDEESTTTRVGAPAPPASAPESRSSIESPVLEGYQPPQEPGQRGQQEGGASVGSSRAADMAGQAANQAAGMASYTAGQAAGQAEEVADQAGQLADQVGELAGKAAGQASYTAGQVADQTGQILEQAGQVASQAIKEAEEAGFIPPLPKRFNLPAGKELDIVGASASALVRFGLGAFVAGYSPSLGPATNEPAQGYSFGSFMGRRLIETSTVGVRPAQPIVLYEFEGCPFCKKVREMATYLDLDVLFYPCPANGPNFRPKAIQMGGKRQFPYMVDPNTGVSMYESDAIIKYLAVQYGDGSVPVPLSLGAITAISASLGLLPRMGRGSRYVPARQPEEPLQIWAYEASPFCKIVREELNELELPHVYINCARGSRKREELMAKTGTFQVPYLEDPNTGVKTFESGTIIKYLRETYAL